MKKAFILHGMSGSVDSSFGIKLKEDLTKLGYTIVQPSFSTGKNITLKSWMEEMEKLAAEIDKDSIFICHSLACLMIIKFFAKNKISNKLIVAVAGGLCKESEVFKGFEHLIPFIPNCNELDLFAKLENTVYNIYSDNDHIYNLAQLERYTKATSATPIFLPNKGHFGSSSGVTEIPEIVDIILKNSQNK